MMDLATNIVPLITNGFPPVLMDDVPKIGFHCFGKMYKVSIREYIGSKGYWTGTKITFSGKNASYFYKQTHDFDWSLLKFEESYLCLGYINLCFIYYLFCIGYIKQYKKGDLN